MFWAELEKQMKYWTSLEESQLSEALQRPLITDCLSVEESTKTQCLIGSFSSLCVYKYLPLSPLRCKNCPHCLTGQWGCNSWFSLQHKHSCCCWLQWFHSLHYLSLCYIRTHITAVDFTRPTIHIPVANPHQWLLEKKKKTTTKIQTNKIEGLSKTKEKCVNSGFAYCKLNILEVENIAFGGMYVYGVRLKSIKIRTDRKA